MRAFDASDAVERLRAVAFGSCPSMREDGDGDPAEQGDRPMPASRQASSAKPMTLGQRLRGFMHPNADWPQPINPSVLEHERKRAAARQNRAADAITGFSGSMLFVYVHVVWFACWIGFGVEGYPYGLLTMIVSLEAIFLSTFVLISQNRADAKRQVLADQQWATVQD